MTITRDDWIKDTAWKEQHLTAKGWRRGSVRTEKGRFEYEVDPPPDCLMTVRCFERVPSNPKDKPKDWTEIRWRVAKDEGIQDAQGKWGVLPTWAPALSVESASKHFSLRHLATMKLSESLRPLGSRIRFRYGSDG